MSNDDVIPVENKDTPFIFWNEYKNFDCFENFMPITEITEQHL